MKNKYVFCTKKCITNEADRTINDPMVSTDLFIKYNISEKRFLRVHGKKCRNVF